LTRPVALFLAVEMAFAYLIAHRPQGSWPLANGGVVALQFLFIFLHIAAAGPGSFALDEVFFRGSRVNAAADLLLSRFSGLTLVILRAGSAFLFVQYGAS